MHYRNMFKLGSLIYLHNKKKVTINKNTRNTFLEENSDAHTRCKDLKSQCRIKKALDGSTSEGETEEHQSR